MGVLGCLCSLRWYGELPAIPRPPPPSRTDWTRLVPPPVLTRHVSSLLPARGNPLLAPAPCWRCAASALPRPPPAQIVPGSGAAHMPSNLQGTFNYMSPEAFDPELFGGVTFKTDVWSVPPLGESTLRGDTGDVLSGPGLEIPDASSRGIV